MVVGPREALASRTVPVAEVNWLGDAPFEAAPEGGWEAAVRVRSTRPPKPARIHPAGAGRARVELLGAEEGVAPGQACVFYAARGHAGCSAAAGSRAAERSVERREPQLHLVRRAGRDSGRRARSPGSAARPPAARRPPPPDARRRAAAPRCRCARRRGCASSPPARSRRAATRPPPGARAAASMRSRSAGSANWGKTMGEAPPQGSPGPATPPTTMPPNPPSAGAGLAGGGRRRRLRRRRPHLEGVGADDRPRALPRLALEVAAVEQVGADDQAAFQPHQGADLRLPDRLHPGAGGRAVPRRGPSRARPRCSP